ncbi:putative bifunctional diguanylate cyclase/phosphodiesterase [Sphingomonas endolithica]|uniref:putative bifunctional diguanylate cyclase/phosphodiesterase n=1 Tax=Sphingomonas endolithica TaxID=2972485 RepID=UPI0021AFFA22|nr:EAL domain-containing protein [Sphingomonas sp. ZFBP2030]
MDNHLNKWGNIRKRFSGLILLGAAFVSITTAATRFGAAADRSLDGLRSGVVSRQASGNVVVVELDAASTAAIKRWPWSRDNYARVVDRLSSAGAGSIVFDVDFSSTSDAAGDRAFAAAISNAGGRVALPTFGQQRSADDVRTIDALPLPLLRPHAALVSVSIAPDLDGSVRDMPFATMTAGVPRPSLSSYIAGRSGVADALFPIDMSIDPKTIPRLSFVAVRDGKFDPKLVRGRDVLIGATAVEMGDRYGTPSWGVLPGVIVQALAAETLIRGIPVRGSVAVAIVLALMLAGLIVRQRSTGRIMLISALGAAVLISVALLAQHAFQVVYPIAAALMAIGTASAACLGRDVLRRFDLQRTTDDATNLPNRRAWQYSVDDQRAIAVAIAEIGNYESLHAVLGSQAASDVVVRLAERLRLSSEDARVYRISNRQLGVSLSAEQPIEDSMSCLRAILIQPVEVAGRRVDVTTTIGVAQGARQGLDRLLADAAMAADQAQVEGTFWRLATTDLADVERSISLMGELDQAISAGEIDVYYQPKLNLKEQRITSVEALVRWKHPIRGFIGPDLFIPLAEQTDRIAPLTIYVLKRVLADLQVWRGRGHNVAAAINISAKLLSSQSFNAEIERALASFDAPTTSLIFEVTESATMSDPAAAIAALRRYRDLGVAVSLDDYGTGQSTLTYLQQLPLNELKIDRSFVQFAHQNHNDAVLVRSTIKLAHDLGLKVVAEGVEDVACREFLAASDCDLIQGYLISRPVPLGDLIGLLEAAQGGSADGADPYSNASAEVAAHHLRRQAG